jgi:3-deoxy-D-manno-octulosonic-acid transferase
LINPSFAVFTKYEYWYYFFEGLHRRGIPLFLISAIFRPDQIFFQAYGTFFSENFKLCDLLVQNEESVRLLKEFGIRNAGLAGDTRFDRVVDIPKSRKMIPRSANLLGKSGLGCRKYLARG